MVVLGTLGSLRYLSNMRSLICIFKNILRYITLSVYTTFKLNIYSFEVLYELRYRIEKKCGVLSQS